MSDYPKVDFWLDDKSQGSIHKLTVRGQQDERVEDLFVVDKSGAFKLITHISPILEKIPREFRAVRIYADVEGEEYRKLRNYAEAISREV